jgi:hypothetical protein
MKISCGCEVSDAEILEAAGAITSTVNQGLSTGRRPGRPRCKRTPEQVKEFREDWDELGRRYSFRKIGEILGISASKAHSLYRQAVQKPAG